MDMEAIVLMLMVTALTVNVANVVASVACRDYFGAFISAITSAAIYLTLAWQ